MPSEVFLQNLKAQWKGKVPNYFWQLLAAFDADKPLKIGPDSVTVKLGHVWLLQGPQIVAGKKGNELGLHWNKPSMKHKAQVVAAYYGVPWEVVQKASELVDGVWVAVAPISQKLTAANILSAVDKITLHFESLEEEKPSGLEKFLSVSPPSGYPLDAEPDDVQIGNLWGLDAKCLLPVAADFYLLAEASLHQSWVRFHYQQHAGRAARLVAGYLAMAIGGELRHCRNRPDWLNGLLKGSRRRAWKDWERIWSELGPSGASERAAKAFRLKGAWRPGYGGVPWGKAAEILAQWHCKELSDALFVDTAMQLQHNTGCIFNKWFMDLSGLKELLDAKFMGRHPVLLRYASDTVRRIFLNSLPQDREGQRREWARGFGVQRVMTLVIEDKP